MKKRKYIKILGFWGRESERCVEFRNRERESEKWVKGK